MYATKFAPQKTRTELINRDRIVNKLIAFADSHGVLALVTGPSGYGKSTLLSQFMEQRQQKGERVCWLSLDENDNDQDTFITCLSECYIRSCDAEGTQGFKKNLHSYPKTNPHARLGQLLETITQSEDSVKIIFDDFQVITDPELLNIFDWFLKRLPNNLSVFIVTRSEIDLLSINEHRAHNTLLEINASELNFTLSETKQFLEQSEGRHLGDSEIQSLHNKTEGWVAATQLVTLAIKNQNYTSPEHLKPFIEGVSGTDKDLVRYLSACVFNLQNSELQNFFIRTAVLKRFNADLCAAVCEQDNASELLDYAFNQGLFIFELDRSRSWYRYHPLFREFLLAELEKQGCEQYQRVVTLAADWFESKGNTGAAINYYLLGKQYSKACELIANVCVEMVQYRGNHNQLLKWLAQLPIEEILKVPENAICYIWSLIFTRQWDKSTEGITALYQHQPSNEAEQQDLTLKLEMLELLKEVMQGQFEYVKEASPVWLKKWPQAPEFERSLVQSVLGTAHLHTVEFSPARKLFSLAKAGFEKTDCDYGIAWMVALYSRVYFKQGHLSECLHMLQQGLTEANKQMGEYSFASAMLHLNLSAVYCEMNENEQALKHLNDGFSSIDQHGVIDTATMGFIIKSRLQQRQGDVQGAMQTLQEGEAFGRHSKLSNYEITLIVERIFLLLRAAKTQQAHELAEEREISAYEFDKDSHIALDTIQISMIQARLALSKNEPADALKLVTPVLRQSTQRGFNHIEESLSLLSASANYQLGKKNQAYRTLQNIIESAAKENRYGLFVDESYHLTPLLESFIEKNSEQSQQTLKSAEQAFISKLCKILKIETEDTAVTKEEPKTSKPKIELSKREEQLISLLQQGLSNKDIAEHLFLSESTVKWHLSRIYSKVGAKNRVDAIKLITEW